MNKFALHIILLLTLILAACSDSKDTPDPAPATVERTVLVYMVAHNSDLGGKGWDAADITEMKQGAAVGALGRGRRLIVMHQNSQGLSVLKEITAEGVDTLKIYDDTEPSISIARMRRVFDDMRALAPARHYGLVLWSHGTGWLQNGWADPDDKTGKQRAFGLDGGKQMNVTALAKALDGQGFEYIYFDCCHMASVEAAYELRHTTPLIAASTIELPNPGMPYHENLEYLAAGDVAAAAANTFRYYDEFSGSSRTCAMSVIATDGLDALAAATRTLYASATPLPESTEPQRYERGKQCYLYDLDHYAELISQSADALAQWRKALDNVVVYKAATPKVFSTLTISRHSGLSTGLIREPADMTTLGYSDLQWASDAASALPWANE